jgi:hypothetical protein
MPEFYLYRSKEKGINKNSKVHRLCETLYSNVSSSCITLGFICWNDWVRDIWVEYYMKLMY